jgi:hypothetical protein
MSRVFIEQEFRLRSMDGMAAVAGRIARHGMFWRRAERLFGVAL